MCITYRHLELKDGKYWCTKHDLNVRHSDVCDDYEGDGEVRVT